MKVTETKKTEKKVQNPHDMFFKDTFSNPLMARDFIENYLPEPILKMVDLNELEVQNGSHVDEELSELFSDMLFRTKINQRDGYLYFLFEHKSYPDRMVALQLLTYMVRIWNRNVNKKIDTHIPIIIPMVVCHGETKWKISPMFSDLILNFDTLPEEVKQMIPDYRYQLYDLSQFSDEDIKGSAELMIALSVATAQGDGSIVHFAGRKILKNLSGKVFAGGSGFQLLSVSNHLRQFLPIKTH